MCVRVCVLVCVLWCVPSVPSSVNLKRLIERLPACGKYSNLRKQLKIDMAGRCLDGPL